MNVLRESWRLLGHEGLAIYEPRYFELRVPDWRFRYTKPSYVKSADHDFWTAPS